MIPDSATPTQRVRFAILCARAVLPVGTIPEWDDWAEGWLDGTDRTQESADAAGVDAMEADTQQTRDAAAWTAEAAAWTAAWAAAWTAEAATEEVMSWGARTASRAARAAEHASQDPSLDLAALAREAMSDD